jgi:hypothetical protein
MSELTTVDPIGILENGDLMPVRKASVAGWLSMTGAELQNFNGRSVNALVAAGTLDGSEIISVRQLSTTITISAATISAAAADNSYNDSAAGFVAAGFAVGDVVNVTGFTGDVANNIVAAIVTAVTTTKLTIGGTDGDVIVDDAEGETVVITKWATVRATATEIVALGGGASYPSFTGNAGKVLAVNTGETDVEWIEAASGGGAAGGLWTKISTQRTTAAQAVATIAVPAGYDHLRLVGLSRAASTAAGLELTLNNNRTANAYDFERLLAGAAADTLNTTFVRLLQTVSTDRANLFASMDIQFPFVSEAKAKQFYAQQGKSEAEPATFGAVWDNTATVTSIELTPETASGGFAADSVFILYGIKTAQIGALEGASSFIGARATRTTTQAITGATATNVAFDAEDFDTNGFHDTAVNNTRITIPAGVDFVNIQGALAAITGVENDFSAHITKNGSTTYPGIVGSGVRSLNGTRKGLSLSTGPLAVVAGDYFELRTENFSAETLTVAGTFLSVTVLNGGGSAHSTVLTDATTAKTLAVSDIDLYVRFTNAAAKTCTINPEATTAMAVNSEVHLRNVGAGNLTIVQGAGVTVNLPAGGSLVMSTGMSATLKKIGTNAWDLIGQTV